MDKKSILENLRQYSEAELLYKAFFSHETEFHPTERFYQEYNLKKAVDFSGVEPKEILYRQLILDIIQNCHEISLKELAKEQVDMFTTVFIGSSATKKLGDKMVTPRGYEAK